MGAIPSPRSETEEELFCSPQPPRHPPHTHTSNPISPHPCHLLGPSTPLCAAHTQGYQIQCLAAKKASQLPSGPSQRGTSPASKIRMGHQLAPPSLNPSKSPLTPSPTSPHTPPAPINPLPRPQGPFCPPNPCLTPASPYPTHPPQCAHTPLLHPIFLTPPSLLQSFTP